MLRYLHRFGNIWSDIEPCNDPCRIRLVCMGSGILKDGSALGMCQIT